MRVLVTGGSGFIGSAVCRRLALRDRAEILNVDKLTYASNRSLSDELRDCANYRFVQADICDRPELEATIAGFAPDAVMHLAAETHVDRSIDSSDAFIRSNVVGTHVLLEAVRAYWSRLPEPRRSQFRFLHVSTDEVYGSLGPAGQFDESTRYDPQSPYSASKAASDHLAGAWHATYGLPVIVTNCGNNYGPYQFPDKLIPHMILSAVEGAPLPVYGDGRNVRDWIHVDDHAAALVVLMNKGRPGQHYNIGGRNERTNVEIVHAICGIVDEIRPGNGPHRKLVKHVADRPGHDRRYAIDPGKIESEIGWRCEIPFAAGLRRTVEWYLDNGAWWRPLRERVYRGERLGNTDSNR